LTSAASEEPVAAVEIHQRVEVIAINVDRLPTGLAEQQMLMTLAGGNKSLATRGLVNALDQKFLSFPKYDKPSPNQRSVFSPARAKTSKGVRACAA
jgi:hypothetical protein